MTEKENDEEKDNDTDQQNKDFKDDPTDSFIQPSHIFGITEKEPTWSFDENFVQPSQDRCYQNFNGNKI